MTFFHQQNFTSIKFQEYCNYTLDKLFLIGSKSVFYCLFSSISILFGSIYKIFLNQPLTFCFFRNINNQFNKMQKNLYHCIEKWNRCASPSKKSNNPENQDVNRNVSPHTLRSDNSVSSLKKFQRKNNNPQNRLFKETEKKTESFCSNTTEQFKNVLINYQEKLSEKKPISNAKQRLNPYSFIQVFKAKNQNKDDSSNVKNQTFCYGQVYKQKNRSKLEQQQTSLGKQTEFFQQAKCNLQETPQSSNKQRFEYKVNRSLLELNKQLQKQIKVFREENINLKEQLIAAINQKKNCCVSATNTERSSQFDNIKSQVKFLKSQQEYYLQKIIKDLEFSLKQSQQNYKKLEINNIMLLKKINNLERDRKTDELKLKFLKYIKLQLKQMNYQCQDLQRQNEELKKKLALKPIPGFNGNDSLKKQQSAISNLMAASISMQLSVEQDDNAFRVCQFLQDQQFHHKKPFSLEKQQNYQCKISHI